jgi:dihydrofolate synthase/folylpolyglutamate synthase
VTDRATLDYLLGLERFGMVLDLGVIRHLLQLLGNPERRLAAVHVGGTNGKGSTAAFLEGLLRAAGHRVGLYTSPHLVRFEERIRVDAREVDEADVVRLVAELRALLEAHPVPAPAGGRTPTFFEFTTAIAFAHFARAGVDYAVIEVGLGGRLDATNVLAPRVSIITNIDLDHTAQLGSTLEAVAREKLGIVKPRTPLVTAERRPELLVRFVEACAAAEAPLQVLAECGARGGLGAARPCVERFTDGRIAYRGLRLRLEDLRLGLAGAHQADNAGLALLAAECLGEGALPADEGGTARALAGTRWPGRLEQVSERPKVLLDGAHNPAGARALARALREEYRYGRLVLVASVMADKDVEAMMAVLAPLADVVVATRAAVARAADPERLAEAARAATGAGRVVPLRGAPRPRVLTAPGLPAALELALGEAGPDDLVLVTGSLYAVGEARARLLGAAGGPL